MKELIFDYNFDLKRTIKQSKKVGHFKGAEEAYVAANYILDNFAKNNLGKELDLTKKDEENATIKSAEEINPVITKKDLQNATIKTIETTNTTLTKTDGTIIKRRKVVKYYVMVKKEQLQIIRQVTEYMRVKNKKTMNRTTSYLEQEDLIEEGILFDDGKLNKEHPLVKKLIPKKKKDKKATK